MRTFAFAVLFLAYGLTGAAQAQPALSEIPFWRASAGWWEGENTYFKSDMSYQVRDYASIAHVEIDGTAYRETEYRFYPHGTGTERYAGGLATDGEGVELIQVYTGSLTDDAGTVDLPPGSGRASANGAGATYKVLSDTDAVRLRVDPDKGTESYRYYVTLVGDGHRYKSNLGLLYEGDNVSGLRAFILYREHRMDGAAFEARRAALRAKYNVTVLNEPDADAPDGWTISRIAK
jgi:hypothetical protein